MREIERESVKAGEGDISAAYGYHDILLKRLDQITKKKKKYTFSLFQQQKEDSLIVVLFFFGLFLFFIVDAAAVVVSSSIFFVKSIFQFKKFYLFVCLIYL